MRFNTYLKTCRDQSALTQEELVHQLYTYNIELFEGLDTSTLSKWERGVTQPKAQKQVSLIKYFQTRTGMALPCLDDYTVDEAEDLICKTGMQNLLATTKQLVLNFPSRMMQLDDIKIYPVRHSQRMEALLGLNMDVHTDINHPFTQISLDQFRSWALHPSNLFLACEYKDGFLGLFFSLRLKPNVFDKIMNFKMKKSDIQIEDFASFDEMGCNFMLSFYALNEKAAIMLGIRYYAHLIANQKCIDEIGVITQHDDVIKLVRNMNLEEYETFAIDENIEIRSYKQSLSNILASQNVIKMLFSKLDQ